MQALKTIPAAENHPFQRDTLEFARYGARLRLAGLECAARLTHLWLQHLPLRAGAATLSNQFEARSTEREAGSRSGNLVWHSLIVLCDGGGL